MRAVAHCHFRAEAWGIHGAGSDFCFLLLTVACFLPAKALAQGETTSAIVGQVRDTTNAVVPGAAVTITNHETGLKRSARDR